MIALEVRDPREQELPAVGDLWLVDPETGRQLRVDTNRRKIRERFAARAAAGADELARELRRAGAEHIVLSTAGDWLRELARLLNREREAAPMSFEWPLALLGSDRGPLRRGCTSWPSAGGAHTRCASPTSTCSAAS